MNDVDLTLLGDDELQAILKGLDEKTQQKFLKKVVSDVANIYVKAAKRRVPIRTTKLTPPLASRKHGWHPPGAGRASIGKKMGRSKRNATVFVGPRTGSGDKSRDGWYLRFPEKGTRGQAGHFWFRIAYASNMQRVEKAMADSMRKILGREIRKHNKR